MTTTLTRPMAPKKPYLTRTVGLVRKPTSSLYGLIRLTFHYMKKPHETQVYGVSEIGCDLDGRGFQMQRQTGPDEEPAEVYSVFVAANGHDHACSCPAGTWGNSGSCKHRESILGLITAGKL